MARRRKSYLANNPLTLLNKISGTQWEDAAHLGTPREVQRGGCYKGDGVATVINLGGRRMNNPDTTFFISFICDTAPDVSLSSIFGTSPSGGYDYMNRIYYSGGSFFTYWCPDTFVNNSDIIQEELPLEIGKRYDIHFVIDGATNRCKIIINGEIFYDQVYVKPIIEDLKLYYGVCGSQSKGLQYNGVKICRTGIVEKAMSEADCKDHNANWLLPLPYSSFYKCDEHSGGIAYDSSGNRYHGKMNDAITASPETDPNSIHQYQNTFSWQNLTGYSILKFYNSVPRQFVKIDTAFRGGNLAYNSFDFTTIGLRGTTGGIYSDEIGPFVYNVDSLRVEVSNGLFFPTDASINIRIFLSEADGLSLSEDWNNVNSLRTASFAYIDSKGIADTAPTTVDTYYQAASQVDKDELDQIFIDRGISNWTAYYNGLPATWKESPSGINAAWIPTIRHMLQIGTTELQTFLVPHEPLSTNSNNSFIKILGGLRARIDSSIMGRARESRLYEYFVLENNETTLVPRDESIQLPPFRDVIGNSLEFIGHVPNNFDLVNAACFQGDDGTGSAIGPQFNVGYDFRVRLNCYLDNLSTDIFTYDGRIGQGGILIHFGSNSNLAIWSYGGPGGDALVGEATNVKVGDLITLDLIYAQSGVIFIVNGSTFNFNYVAPGIPSDVDDRSTRIGTRGACRTWNVLIDRYDSGGNFISELAILPLSEPIINTTNHTYFNKLNTNHFILTDGSEANYGRQNIFFDLMVNGFSNRTVLDLNTDPFVESGDLPDGWENPGNAVTSFTAGVFSIAPVDVDNDGAILIGNIGLRFGDGETNYRITVVARGTAGDKFGIFLGQDGGSEAATIDSASFKEYVLEGNIIDSSLDRANWQVHADNADAIEFQSVIFEEVGAIFIPASAVNPLEDATGNPLTHPQSGVEFLQCGTELQAPTSPELITDDINNIFFSAVGLPIARSWGFLDLNQYNNNQYFIGNKKREEGILTSLAFHAKPLERKQLDTEKMTRSTTPIGDEDAQSLFCDVNVPSSMQLINFGNPPTFFVDGRIFISDRQRYSTSDSTPFQNIGGFRMNIGDLSLIKGLLISRGFSGTLNMDKLTGLSTLSMSFTNLEELIFPKNLTISSIDLSFNQYLIRLDLSSLNYTGSTLRIRYNIGIKDQTIGLKEIITPLNPQPNVRSVDFKENLLKKIDLRAFTHATSLDLYSNELTEILLPDTDSSVELNIGENLNLSGVLDLRIMPNIHGQLNIYACSFNEILFPPDCAISELDARENNMSVLNLKPLINCTEFDLRNLSNLESIQFPNSDADISSIDLRGTTGLKGLFDISGLTNFRDRLRTEESPEITAVALPSSEIGPFTLFDLKFPNAVWNADFTKVEIIGKMSIQLDSVSGFTFYASNKACPDGLELNGYTLNTTTVLDLSDILSLGDSINFEGSRFQNYIFPDDSNIISSFIAPDNPAFQGTLDLGDLGFIQGVFNVSNNPGMTGLTWPSLFYPFTFLDIHGCRIGYTDFSRGGRALETDDANWDLSDNQMTAEDVNHILVDLDDITDDYYINRTINIGGNNAAPDSTSGGYDGLAAIVSLEDKDFTIIHN